MKSSLDEVNPKEKDDEIIELTDKELDEIFQMKILTSARMAVKFVPFISTIIQCCITLFVSIKIVINFKNTKKKV